jgi:hypothetical protein
MGIPSDEHTLQQLEQEKTALESRPTSGYADASRVARLNSEIEAVEDRTARKKQRAEHGEG